MPEGRSQQEELERALGEIENLKLALVTCRRIGIAVGILMARRGLTEQAAFEALATASQCRHRKVRDIADDVILTGDL